MEMIVQSLFCLLCLGFAALPGICVIRCLRQRRKDREAVRRQCRDVAEKLTAGGKLRRPHGKGKPQRWANRWIDYIHGMPTPRPQSQRYAQFQEMPRPPSGNRRND